MTIQEALAGAGIPSADAEVLLGDILQQNRTWLLAHRDAEIKASDWSAYMKHLERRRKFEPVAYIVGTQEFYGRLFAVTPAVLIPRPATEGVVRGALRFLDHPEDFAETVDEGIAVMGKVFRPGTVNVVVDVGTGSGCIAITLALERPNMKIIATDVSADALSVAKKNAENHHVSDRVTFYEGDGFDPLHDLTDPFLLVSNPPYIPSARTLMKDVVDFEPHVALFGGKKGIEIVRRLQSDAEAHPYCVGYVMEVPK